jgi:hypothetical protein
MNGELRVDPVQGSIITARPHWLPEAPANQQRASKSKRWVNFISVLFLTTLIYAVPLRALPDLRSWMLNFSSSWPYVIPFIIAYVLINLYTFLAIFSPSHYLFRSQPKTPTQSQQHELIRIPISETAKSAEIQQGFAQVVVPRDSMHSLLVTKPGNSYGFKWEIVFKGDVAIFPDFEDRIEVVVLPEKIV